MPEALARALRRQPRWKDVGLSPESKPRGLLTVNQAGPTMDGRFFLDVHIKALHMGPSSVEESSTIGRDIFISCCSPLVPFGGGENTWVEVSDASTGADFRWQMKDDAVNVFCVNGLGTHMVFVPATPDDAQLFTMEVAEATEAPTRDHGRGKAGARVGSGPERS